MQSGFVHVTCIFPRSPWFLISVGAHGISFPVAVSAYLYEVMHTKPFARSFHIRVEGGVNG